MPVADLARTLVRDHQPALHAFALKLCGNPADAHDLVQDTFERALRNLGALKEGTNERAWLFTILHNLFIDRCRRKKRDPAAANVDEVELPAGEPEPPPGWTSLGAADVRAAVAQLDDEFRRVYELHALDGRSYQEIAATLGIPQNTVGTRLLRARKKLKSILELSLEKSHERAV
jgi:RNA polymerase sigma-70 factor (ECF subfamily)